MKEKIFLWLSILLMFVGLWFIVSGVIGNNGILIFVGLVFIALNIKQVWNMVRKRQEKAKDNR
jgi:Flp pilus assembly protein TadB